MESITLILLFGFLGGVVRGLVGFIKYRYSYKDVEFKPWYFGGTMIVSGAIGLLAAWITDSLGIRLLGLETIPPALAVVIGYAGGDFIENIYKTILGSTSLYEIPTDLSLKRKNETRE